MSFQRASAIFLAASAALAGCSSTPVAQAPATPAAAPATAAKPAPAPATASVPKAVPSSTVATVTLPAYLDPKSPISSDRSVYFDFDGSAIKSDYAGLIERHGKYLASHPGVSIKVEGNADERAAGIPLGQ